MIRRITIFLTVSKYLSYTKASQELYMSQPAVTKNIQELEQELEVRLFNRRGNSIELTPAGKLVHSYGSDINRLVQNLKYELGSMNNRLMGDLQIGASSTISQYLIPTVIAGFNDAHPDVSVSLLSGNTAEINKKLSDDVIDIGITEGGRKHRTFDYIPFMEDEIAFIYHHTKRNSIPEFITPKDLADLPLVIRETGSGTREVFEEALDKAGMKLSNLNVTITLGSTESIKSYLIDSEAVGVFSVNAIRKEERTLFHISRLEGCPIQRTFQFMLKHGSSHKLANAFIGFCRRHYNLSL